MSIVGIILVVLLILLLVGVVPLPRFGGDRVIWTVLLILLILWLLNNHFHIFH